MQLINIRNEIDNNKDEQINNKCRSNEKEKTRYNFFDKKEIRRDTKLFNNIWWNYKNRKAFKISIFSLVLDLQQLT